MKRIPTPAAAPAADAAPAPAADQATTPPAAAGEISPAAPAEPAAPPVEPAPAPAAEAASGEPATEEAQSEAPVEPEVPAVFEARVLVAFDGHEVNEVISLTEVELRDIDGVTVDTHPAAVAYAKSLIA